MGRQSVHRSRPSLAAVASALFLVVYFSTPVEGQSSTWVSTSGPYVGTDPATCNCIAAGARGRLYAGSVYANGLFTSTDRGDTWTLVPLEPAPILRTVVSLVLDVQGRLLVGTQGGLYIASAEGDSPASVAITPDYFGAVGGFSNGYLLAASGTAYSPKVIFRSTDGGQSWTESYRLPLSPPAPSVGPFISLACGDSGYAWISNDNLWMLRSTDYGASWKQPVAVYFPNVEALTFDQGGVVLAGGERGILRSTDHGGTWALSNGGLLDTVVLSLARNRDNHIFAGTRSGVFRSTDVGLSWMEARNGIADIAVNGLALDELGYAYAATQGNGVMRTVGTTLSVEPWFASLPVSFGLYQNYPNPFNPSTTIKYELPRSSEVRLSVFDMLGREVSVLVNERRDAGVHEVKFDGAGLSSGVYFYRLRAGDFVQAKRTLLLK